MKYNDEDQAKNFAAIKKPMFNQHKRRIKLSFLIISIISAVGFIAMMGKVPAHVQILTTNLVVIISAFVFWRRGSHFRWAAISLALLFIASMTLFWELWEGRSEFLSYDDPFFLLGMALMAVYLYQIQPRLYPAWIWYLGFFYLAVSIIQFTLTSIFGSAPLDFGSQTILATIIIMAGLPVIAVVTTARASTAHLFWFLGWQMWWLGDLLGMVSESNVINLNINTRLSIHMWGSGLVLFGLIAEARHWKAGLLPYVLGVGSLLICWLFGLIFLRSTPDSIFMNWLICGGIILFVNTLIFFRNYQNEILRTRKGLRHEAASFIKARMEKSEFLASLSHEFRTPLNVIVGFSELLSDYDAVHLNPVQLDLVHEIKRSSAILTNLISRLLDYSKLEAGKTPLELQKFAIKPWLDIFIIPYSARAKEKGLNIHIKVDADLDICTLDLALTQQAIGELIDHAIDYSDKSDINLIVSRADNEQLSLYIGASNHIIPDNHFLDFEHLSNTYYRNHQNAELGLALANECAKVQSGRLRIASDQGPNSAFILLIPLFMDNSYKQATGNRSVYETMLKHVDGAETAWIPYYHKRIAIALIVILALIPIFLSTEWPGRLLASLIYFIGAGFAWRAGRALPLRLVATGLALAATAFAVSAFALLFQWMEWYQQRWLMFIIGDIICITGLGLLKPRLWPQWALLGFIIPLGATLHLFSVFPLETNAIADQYSVLIILLGIGVTLPAMQFALRGYGAYGRLIWVSGLFIYWFSAYGDALFSLSSSSPALLSATNIHYAYGAFLVGLGLFIEHRHADSKNASFTMMLVMGPALLIWGTDIVYLRANPEVMLFWIISGGAIINLMGLGILYSLQRRNNLLLELLRQIYRQSFSANEDKNYFIASLSHELRTHLNTLVGFSELLESGDMGDMDEFAAKDVAAIAESGEHLVTLITDVIDLTYTGECSSDLSCSAVDVAQLLNNCLMLVGQRAMEKSVELDIEINNEVGLVSCDPLKVKQISYNLLSNAIKFTPAGGKITLSAGLESRQTVLSHQNAVGFSIEPLADFSRFLAIRVVDSGIGINLQDQQKLFRAYSQLEAGKAQIGTGLGLHLVKNLAAQHGGTVMIESQPNKGSTFTVWLAYEEPEATNSPTPDNAGVMIAIQ